ncbi:MAG TPA: hypothetical protein VNQ80_04250 [Parapedobacter sp.]|uniref:hypothetical protein n=1 Tax=Parapedobacter sp. TaxID=1958893 RepID=UPI002B65D3B7|nr:hypothetical protein [Parapedobacter sp.]HWK56522.1 hypothetical protein [Parapedobacter sp.]
MKRILRIGEGYAFSKHKLKRTYIRYFSLLAVLTTMCLYAVKQVSAQGAEPAATAVADIKPLQIGDTIPEALWELPLQVVNHPDGKNIITLNDYRGARLLILEFWGSMCPPCIEAIDKINRWQSDFGDDFAALPVLTRSKNFEQSLSLIKNREWSLPSVVNDTLLDRVALSRYLPDWGDVWILDGRLLAVPKFGYLTKETITALLENRRVNFVNKRNVQAINPYQPIALPTIWEDTAAVVKSQSRIIGYLPDQDKVFPTYEQRNDSTFLYMWNWPITNLLYEAYKPDIHPYLNIRQGIDWEVPESFLEKINWKVQPEYSADYITRREQWRADNYYGYQLIYPGLLTDKEARRIMQHDLNAFLSSRFDIRAEIKEQGFQKYAVLEPIQNTEQAKNNLVARTDSIYTDHDEKNLAFYGYGFSTLVHNISTAIRDNPNLNLTIREVADSTGIEGNFKSTFSLPRRLRERNRPLAEIQSVLRQYGLKLDIESRELPILVVYQVENRKNNSQP